MATEGASDPGARGRPKGVKQTLKLDEVGRAWRRIPRRVRTWGPELILLALAALYPTFYEQAQDALKKGDLATYQRRINQMADALGSAQKIIDAPKK